MSDYETHKGTLTRANKTKKEVVQEYLKGGSFENCEVEGLFEELEDRYVELDGEIFSIEDERFYDEEDIYSMTQNKDGTYSYLTRFYNGGCGFGESLQAAFDDSSIDLKDRRFTVYVDGTEVNDYYLTRGEAENLADEYRDDGYLDVEVDYIEKVKDAQIEQEKTTEALQTNNGIVEKCKCGSTELKVETTHSCEHCMFNGYYLDSEYSDELCVDDEMWNYDEDLLNKANDTFGLDLSRHQSQDEGECQMGSNWGAGCSLYVCSHCGDTVGFVAFVDGC